MKKTKKEIIEITINYLLIIMLSASGCTFLYILYKFVIFIPTYIDFFTVMVQKIPESQLYWSLLVFIYIFVKMVSIGLGYCMKIMEYSGNKLFKKEK